MRSGDQPVGTANDLHWRSFHLVPPRASSIAGEVDAIAITWLVFSIVVVLLVFGMITTFCLKYRGREMAVQRLSGKVRNGMEWSWTILLAIITLAIGLWADKVYMKMHLVPAGATPIYVMGKQWMWKIEHEDGTREINELHLPVGEPVQLIMSSEDVIHSFFVPAFRIKQDVVPGRYTYISFTPTRPGRYRLFCTQYCGTSHSVMSGQVVVMKPADYQIWKTTQVSYHSGPGAGLSGSTLVARGRELFTNLGCASCHDTGGNIAPVLDGLYMSWVGLNTGEKVLADENYLRESILVPGAKIVKGYLNVMPSFQGQVSEDDLLSLISYIKSRQYRDRSSR